MQRTEKYWGDRVISPYFIRLIERYFYGIKYKFIYVFFGALHKVDI